jgi:hypothetical protein
MTFSIYGDANSWGCDGRDRRYRGDVVAYVPELGSFAMRTATIPAASHTHTSAAVRAAPSHAHTRGAAGASSSARASAARPCTKATGRLVDLDTVSEPYFVSTPAVLPEIKPWAVQLAYKQSGRCDSHASRVGDAIHMQAEWAMRFPCKQSGRCDSHASRVGDVIYLQTEWAARVVAVKLRC